MEVFQKYTAKDRGIYHCIFETEIVIDTPRYMKRRKLRYFLKIATNWEGLAKWTIIVPAFDIL
jgi:hypothetical protein